MFSLRSVSKTFPGQAKPALDGVSADFSPGTVTAVLGENGAGKTTLMHIASGLLASDSGSVFSDGTEFKPGSPRIKKVVGMVHQQGTLSPFLTVGENAFLGREPRRWGVFTDMRKIHAETDRVMEKFGFSLDSRSLAGSLPLVQCVEAEIVRAVSRDPPVIILDEPTQVLSETEAERIYNILASLAAGGKTVIVVTHKVAEALKWSSRIVVLHAGKVVAARETALTSEQELLELLSFGTKGGQQRSVPDYREDCAAGHPVFELDGVCADPLVSVTMALEKVSISVAKGESVSVLSAPGNGLSTLEDVVSGFRKPRSGTLKIEGMEVVSDGTAFQGIGYVPQDRHGRASVPSLDAMANFALRESVASRFLSFSKGVRARALASLRAFAFSDSPYKPASGLSGGTVQKMILARELGRDAPFFLLCHPLRGLDLESRAIAVERIRSLKDSGKGVLTLTHDPAEAFDVSDRVLVLSKGKIVSEHSPGAKDGFFSAASFRSGGRGA